MARTTEEHLLDRLFIIGRITDIQRDAAFRFKEDFHAAGMIDRLTGSYNPARSSFSVFGGWDELSDREEAAYQRWRQAMRFLKGTLSDVMVSVICHDVWPDANH